MSGLASSREWRSTACWLCVSIEAGFVPAGCATQHGKPMADEDDELPQDETPEQRLFSLTEAERTRRELEPVLIEAMECRKKLSGLDAELGAVAARIMMMGGVLVPHDKLSLVRLEHTRLA